MQLDKEAYGLVIRHINTNLNENITIRQRGFSIVLHGVNILDLYISHKKTDPWSKNYRESVLQLKLLSKSK